MTLFIKLVKLANLQARELAEWRTLAEQRQQLLEGEVAKAAAGESLSEETTRTLTQQVRAFAKRPPMLLFHCITYFFYPGLSF